MKYCEEYAALLDLFVDGELPRDEMERVRAHLADCPGCRAYVDDALVIRAGFPDVEDTPVPEGFVEGVMDRIRAAGAESEKSEKVVELKRRSVRRWVGTAAALAACCALVVLVQTGPGGAGGLKAATDTAAPSGYNGGEEAGAAPQMADPAEPEETPQNYAPRESTQLTTAGGAQKSEEQQRSVPAAAPSMEAAAEDSANAAAAYEEIALCLTAEEAGDLLDEFTPEQEDGSERRYTLNQEQYEALLEALGRWEKLPETPEMSFQVVVTGPIK